MPKLQLLGIASYTWIVEKIRSGNCKCRGKFYREIFPIDSRSYL